jgi:hypothetical protein
MHVPLGRAHADQQRLGDFLVGLYPLQTCWVRRD